MTARRGALGRALAGAILVLVLALGAPPAAAGAWTQGDGDWYHRLTVTRFEADVEFLEDGSEEPFDFGGRFRDTTVTWYAEYGLTDGWTLFASIPFRAVHYENIVEEGDTDGLFDFDLGARRRLVRGPVVLSVQALVKVPGAYDAEEELPLGNDQTDVEALLQAGQSIGSGRVYWGLEAGYRLRFEEPSDEWRARGEIGARIAGPLALRLKLLRVESAENADDVRDVFGNPLAQLEAERTEAEATATWSFSPRWAAELTWASLFDGRSTAKGESWALSAVARY